MRLALKAKRGKVLGFNSQVALCTMETGGVMKEKAMEFRPGKMEHAMKGIGKEIKHLV